MGENLPEQSYQSALTERQKLSATIRPKDTPEWQGYVLACHKLSIDPPNPEYPFSLYAEYCRIKSFSIKDHEWLAKCGAQTAFITGCIQLFPLLSGYDIYEIIQKHISLQVIKRIAGYHHDFPQIYNQLGSREIIVLSNASEGILGDYLQWYATDKGARNTISFATLIETCGNNIPLTFTCECLQKLGNTPLFGSTIQLLYLMGGDSLNQWRKYVSWNVPSWSSVDIITLIQARLSDVEALRVMDYSDSQKHEQGLHLGFGARECIELARSNPSPNKEDILSYKRMFPDAPWIEVITCAIAKIPVSKILEYRGWEGKMDSRYFPGSWSLSAIAGMHRAGVSPRDAVLAWDRFKESENGGEVSFKKEICAELLALPGFLSLTDFLSKTPQKITIGKTPFTLANTDASVGFIRGILLTLSQNGRSLPKNGSEWQGVIRQYESNIHEFLNEGSVQEFDKIFYIAATEKEDSVGAFAASPVFRSALESRYGPDTLSDYSLGSPLLRDSDNRASDFIAAVMAYTQSHPGKNVLIHIGFHGGIDGSTGPFHTSDITQLAHIANNPHITLDVMSCFGGNKLDSTTQNGSNIRLSSGKHDGGSSYNELIQAFSSTRHINPDRFHSWKIQAPEQLTLLNHVYFGNAPIIQTGDSAHNISPKANYSEKDIPAILGVKTGDGRTIGEVLGNGDILYELIKNTQTEYAADYDGDGKVSFAEANLYRIMHHRSNLLPTVFATQDGRYKNI